MRGRLYVFEGADGVGKSTTAHRLVKHLIDNGLPCEGHSFPGKAPGTLGAHIYKLHHELESFEVNQADPASLQMLHVAAHIDAINTNFIPKLESGTSIVLDRYWWSTWVYGLVNGVPRQALADMIDVEKSVWGSHAPTIVFLFERQAPLRAEDDTPKWPRLVSEYRELAQRESAFHRVAIVENDTDAEHAFARVLAELDAQTSAATVAASHDAKPSRAPMVFTKLSPAEPSEVFDTYWHFAAERQRIFFRRLTGGPSPFTSDAILQKHKFTNAYRASDRVSQFLIKDVIYRGSQDYREVFFRTLLFKLFNKIETWELLRRNLGEIVYSAFDYDRYDEILLSAQAQGVRIYSAAYIMPSGGRHGDPKKHRTHLKLLQRMMLDEVPARVTEMSSMRQLFELLRSYPTLGDFLAYQYAVDLNYSELTAFSEMEFVVPGPGARDGLRKCFHTLGGLSEADIIRLMADRQQREFERLEIDFKSLWGRPLQLIDCQNLFCEVDKYARVAHPDVAGISGRTRIKQIFQPDLRPIEFWYPPKWGINHLLPAVGGDTRAPVTGEHRK